MIKVHRALVVLGMIAEKSQHTVQVPPRRFLLQLPPVAPVFPRQFFEAPHHRGITKQRLRQIGSKRFLPAPKEEKFPRKTEVGIPGTEPLEVKVVRETLVRHQLELPPKPLGFLLSKIP